MTRFNEKYIEFREGGERRMLMIVLISLGFGIVMNTCIYAYQKGREKDYVDTDMDSDNVDSRINRNNVRHIER